MAASLSSPDCGEVNKSEVKSGALQQKSSVTKALFIHYRLVLKSRATTEQVSDLNASKCLREKKKKETIGEPAVYI